MDFSCDEVIEEDQMTTCHACAFWTSGNQHNGLCPLFGATAERVGRSDRVLARNLSGRLMRQAVAGVNAPQVLKCGGCIFWRQSGGDPGVYPVGPAW